MSGVRELPTGLVFEVARVTIEMETPFLVGAGEGDGLHDEVFVADANGLPTIPGESLAGVLRHALAAGTDPATDDRCRRCFGFQDGDDGEASAVTISFAQAHDSSDRPVPFRGARMNDPVLRALTAGVPRDHVRIGPHGAVDGRGKFDELLVPAGARFTFEMIVDARSPLRAAELLDLLARPEVRLGRATRGGLGGFHVVRATGARFDLRVPQDRGRFAALPVALEEDAGDILAPLEATSAANVPRQWVAGAVHLEALDTWLIGGTLPSGREPNREGGGKPNWDRFPFAERHIVWRTETSGMSHGQLVDVSPFVVPGSSVKGALRHRTAYHARRRSGQFVGKTGLPIEPTAEEVELFGEVKGETGGRAGCVVVGDARASEAATLAKFQHVCLDRFTQAPRDGLLFDELAVLGGTLDIPILVRTDGLSSHAARAFQAALADLCEGRLTLGAGRAHGHFQGTVEWDEEGRRWLEELRS